MTQTDLTDKEQEELERYLYAELTAEESDELEEKFFLDDELFFEAVELENKMVDLYTRGELSGRELSRFEKSLEKLPERKRKIANASAFQAYAADEPVLVETEEAVSAVNTKTAETVSSAAETQSLWQKIAGLFKSPFLSPVMAALVVMLTITGILLFLDSRRKGEELARLQSEREGIESVWEKRESELRNQLTNSNGRIENLQSQLADKDEDTGELIKTLNSEQQKKRELERELTKIREETNTAPLTTEKTPGPAITSILLSQADGGRDGGGGRMQTTSVGENTKKLAVNLSLPDAVKKEDQLSVRLNEKPFLQNVSPTVAADGKKSLSLTIPTKNLPAGENKLSVINAEGKEVIGYIFNVDKP